MPSVNSPVRFGAFEVDLRSGELRKGGTRIHLAEQPLQVLTVLLERPGELVTREELRERLWRDDTFVDFENGLNAAVKRLRERLGDSADKPRFIETIPRRGYRFIAPLAETGLPPAASAAAKLVSLTRRRSVIYGAVAGLFFATVLGLAILARTAWHRTGGAEPAGAVRTIAVLPFKDMSPEKDQQYFGDGLADELITRLVTVPELRVSARTSSFQFRSEDSDARSVGEKLHVRSIVEGAVRKYGKRVRITAQLINAADGFQLWAQSFDRDLNDIFALQTEIARAVAEALKVSLLETRSNAASAGADDVESYNLYLQGRYFAERRSQEDMKKAIGYYEQAIKLNRNSARAWAGIAEAHTYQADSGYVPVEEGYGKARVEVERALAMDANLAKAHEIMGYIKMVHDWNWEGANASFQRALTLEPGSATAVWKMARLYLTVGLFQESLRLDRKAVELDPLNTLAYLNLGNAAYYQDKQDEAAGALAKVLELNPDLPPTRAYLGRVYLLQGRREEALSAMLQERDPPWRSYGLALAYHALGRASDSETALAALIEKYGDTFAYQIAQVYAYRGNADRAFQWLDTAYAQRDGGLSELKGDPLLKGLGRDARLSALLTKMNNEGSPLSSAER